MGKNVKDVLKRSFNPHLAVNVFLLISFPKKSVEFVGIRWTAGHGLAAAAPAADWSLVVKQWIREDILSTVNPPILF